MWNIVTGRRPDQNQMVGNTPTPIRSVSPQSDDQRIETGTVGSGKCSPTRFVQAQARSGAENDVPHHPLPSSVNNLSSFLPPCFLLLVLKSDVFAIYQTHCRRQSRLEQALRQANVLSHLCETVVSRSHARCDHDLGATAGFVP